MDGRARKLILAALLCLAALLVLALSLQRTKDEPMPVVPPGADARSTDEPEPHPQGFGTDSNTHYRRD